MSEKLQVLGHQMRGNPEIGATVQSLLGEKIKGQDYTPERKYTFYDSLNPTALVNKAQNANGG